MAKARRKRTSALKKKTVKPVRGRRGSAEVLSGKDWTVGSFAWNKDGNIVILDPRLAQYIRQRARDDRELEIGIPSAPTKVQKPAGGGEVDYDPYPDGSPTGSVHVIKPLGLCACDYLRLHLASDGPALHGPLTRDQLDASSIIS